MSLSADAVSKIDHPAVRELLQIYKVAGPIELNHMTDLPSRSGMGSSSAFVVGLSSILEKSRGTDKENLELAKLAIDKTFVGEIFTHLGLDSSSKEGLDTVAKELLEFIKKKLNVN